MTLVWHSGHFLTVPAGTYQMSGDKMKSIDLAVKKKITKLSTCVIFPQGSQSGREFCPSVQKGLLRWNDLPQVHPEFYGKEIIPA